MTDGIINILYRQKEIPYLPTLLIDVQPSSNGIHQSTYPPKEEIKYEIITVSTGIKKTKWGIILFNVQL